MAEKETCEAVAEWARADERTRKEAHGLCVKIKHCLVNNDRNVSKS